MYHWPGKVFFAGNSPIMKRHLWLGLVMVYAGISACSPSFDDARYRCKINGKEFTASNELITVTHNVEDAYFIIRGTRLYGGPLSSAPYGEMEIRFSFDPDSLYKPGKLGYGQFYYGNNIYDKPFRSTSAKPGSITVLSYDPAGMVQGTFQLTAFADDGDSLVITGGTFHLSFIP